jgi:hypothetical protein
VKTNARYTYSDQPTKKRTGNKKSVSLYSFALVFCWLQNVFVGIPGERAPHYTTCQSSSVLQRRSSSAVGDVTDPPHPTPTTTITPPIKSPWMNISCQSSQHTSPSKTKQSGHEKDPKRTVPDRTELPDCTASLAAAI